MVAIFPFNDTMTYQYPDHGSGLTSFRIYLVAVRAIYKRSTISTETWPAYSAATILYVLI